MNERQSGISRKTDVRDENAGDENTEFKNTEFEAYLGYAVNSYLALDLEMTGLDPKADRIIEIGALRVENDRIAGAYESFVNPHRLLCREAEAMTGITQADLENAPEMETVLTELLEFAGELPLLGHNIISDYRFLKRAAVNGGHAFERDGIDTLALARSWMPKEEKKCLAHACAWFGIDPGTSHRALADALAAHELYQEMKKRYGERKPDDFTVKRLVYKVKKEQPATKRQKEYLHELLKYHKIGLTVQMDHLTRNEISRMTDKIISQYGRI